MLAPMAGGPDLVWGLVLGLAGAAFALASLRLFPPGWRISRLARIRFAGAIFFVLLVSSLFAGRELTTWAAAIGFAVGGVSIVKRARHARLIHSTLRDLLATPPDTRERGVDHLRTLLGPPPARAREHQVWAQTVLWVAAHVHRAGMAREALALVEAVDRSRLDAASLGVRTQLLASCAVTLGDRARARQELASTPRETVSPIFQRALAAMDLLLDALEGAPAEGLEERCRAARAAEDDATVRALAGAALAHTLAASGRRDEAMAELRSLRDAPWGGPDSIGAPLPLLERIAGHRGPASPLAEAVLASEGTPYRST